VGAAAQPSLTLTWAAELWLGQPWDMGGCFWSIWGNSKIICFFGYGGDSMWGRLNVQIFDFIVGV
jgi:hypothetical protein